MNITRRLFLAATFVAIIFIAGHGVASAQCPPGWTHKIRGVSMVFPTAGACLVDIDYCVDPTGTQIQILGYHESTPGCPGLPLDQALSEVEKGVMAMEGNDGDYEGDACTGEKGILTYNVSRYLCYEYRGANIGYIACQGGTCDKSYIVQCLGGVLVFTLTSGPTENGACQPDPEQGCVTVPCN